MLIRITLLTTLLSLCLSSCTTPCYTPRSFGTFTNYLIHITRTTPKYHIQLDDPDYLLDPDIIDQTLSNVSECVRGIYETGFSQEEYLKGECNSQLIEPEIRSCLVIKVAPNWHFSQCSGEEVFSCNIDNTRCIQKGIVPTEACPCSCRAIIQGNAIIITPNMKLLPAQIVTMMTGCLNPWDGRLAACSSPSNVPSAP